MTPVFADTVFWSALFNERDSLHARASELSQSLRGTQIVTSDLILIEFLNAFSGAGPFSRTMSTQTVRGLKSGKGAVVEPISDRLPAETLDLYGMRPDKGWSFTDCSSFLIMQKHGIESALTFDRHFEQAGFKALLR